MNGNVSEPQEEALAAWLIKCEEAIRTGTEPPPLDPTAFPEEVRGQIEGALTGLRLARLLGSRQESVDDATALVGNLHGSEEEFIAAEPQIGGLPWTRIGRFQIERELGRGGFGMVFLAYDPLLGRHVALKVPRVDVVVTPELRERFKREARAASSLDHPNLVPVYEVGEVGPVCFIVSAYCPGLSLAQWLHGRTEPTPFETAARLVLNLAEAVAHAHDRGVIHRDLKPANVLLQKDEGGRMKDENTAELFSDSSLIPHPSSLVPKITDFGLAKNLWESSSDDRTRSGAILGTAGYMAPEQAGGRANEVGPPADIYGLGAILYELLTGRPPFRGDSDLETLDQVRHDDPIPPRRLRPRTPRDLETICLKCLEKPAHKRFQDAHMLVDDLGRYLMGKPILARPVTVVGKLGRWIRRNPLLAGLSAALAACVLLITFGSLASAVWLKASLSRAERAEQAASRRLFETYLAQARAVRQTGRLGQRRESLETLAAAAGQMRHVPITPEDVLTMRNEAIAALALPDLRVDRRYPGYSPEIGDAFIACDASVAHYARHDREKEEIQIRRLEDDGLALGFPVGPVDGPPYVRFGRDGRFVAAKYFRKEEMFVRAWHYTSKRMVYDAPAGGRWFDTTLDISPDGERLAYARPDRAIAVVDMVSGRQTRHTLPGNAPHALRFHPKENQLAVIQQDSSEVQIVSWETGAVKHRLNHSANVASLDWSASGRMLACGCNDNTVHVWDLASGNAHTVLQGHQAGVLHAAFHPDSEVVASTSWDGTTRLWHPRTGKQLLIVEGMATDFSTDGRWLAMGRVGREVGRWEVITSPECRTFCPPGRRIDTAVFSPDDRRLALGTDHGLIFVDPRTFQIEAVLADQNGPCLHFHPSGKRLIATARSRDRLLRWSMPHPFNPKPGATVQSGPVTAAEAVLNLSGERIEYGVIDWEKETAYVVVGQLSESGRVLAIDLRDRMKQPRVVNRQARMWRLALSPDGRFLASSTWNGSNVEVCELNRDATENESAVRVATLPARTATMAFSPDGRWLVVSSNGEYSFYDVGTWGLRHRLPYGRDTALGALAFSPDSRLLAVAHGLNALKILDATDWHELATLTPPQPGVSEAMSFSRDKRYLAVTTANRVLQLWDLFRIRQYLNELGVDWKDPE
jgi:serine/threonine protein kinase/WD40 repeat protein